MLTRRDDMVDLMLLNLSAWYFKSAGDKRGDTEVRTTSQRLPRLSLSYGEARFTFNRSQFVSVKNDYPSFKPGDIRDPSKVT